MKAVEKRFLQTSAWSLLTIFERSDPLILQTLLLNALRTERYGSCHRDDN